MVNIEPDIFDNLNTLQIAQVGKDTIEFTFKSAFGISEEHPLDTFHIFAENQNHLARFYSEWIPVGGVISHRGIIAQAVDHWQNVQRFESIVGMELSNDLNTMRYSFDITAVKLQNV